MKESKITPGSNLLWESMRLMLPEHREAIMEYRRMQHVQPRPQLDDQELERISRAIQESFELKKTISIIKYGQLQNTTFSGIVEKIEQRMVKLSGYWIYMDDIVSIDNIEDP